ncbi:MAG: sulfatase [Planctomycetota bacterium]
MKNSRYRLLATAAMLVALVVTSIARGEEPVGNQPDRPNILWLSTEDIGPELNCYGDATAKTPTLDALASQGVVYDYAWSNYPVCAPARTTIISGMYGASCGAGNMRSSVLLPEGVDAFPHYLRQAGYYCTNNSKTDYNYRKMPNDPWDESSNKAHYRKREKDQPFFAVFNYTGTHESKIRKRPHDAVIDPATVSVKSYWPDTPEVRQDLAQYYDNLETMDQWLKKHLDELEKSGEADNTIVVFFGDHGSGMPRHKRFAGDSGMRVPFVVHVPEKWKSYAGDDYAAGQHSSRPVGFIDLAPTMLSIAGIKPKKHMQGHAFLGSFRTDAPQYLYGFRDRMDERPDTSRSIRDDRFIYVRNYMPHLPAGQHVNYQMQTPTTRVWREMYDAGKLNDVQRQFWELHPPEELYDLINDPEETKNLVGDAKFADVLKRFRDEHRSSYLRFGDTGLIPEVTIKAIDDGSQPPRTLLGNKQSFPMDEIFDLANLAADRSDRGRADLVSAVASPNPTVAYWGAIGALVDGQAGFESARETLLQRVDDENPAVAIACCELVATYGSDDQQTDALNRLAYFADYRNSNVLGSVAALNVIDRLGDKAELIKSSLSKVPPMDPDFSRGKDYINRLLIKVGAVEEKEQKKVKKPKKGKRKEK